MFKRYSIYSTCKTYIEWQANPTITTINTTAYPIENIEFPAITICSQGAAKNVMETVLVKQFEMMKFERVYFEFRSSILSFSQTSFRFQPITLHSRIVCISAFPDRY